jgi:trk system potassium uptake protein TrkH
MNFFDAVCQAFSTTSTGGFSNRNASIGAYSVYSQYITIPFMFLGSTSFILFFYIWKREFKKIILNDEFRFFLTIILGATALICIGLYLNGYAVGQAVRESLFNVVSIISTTGYAINDYMLWVPPLWFIIFLLTFIGGCAGSTSGGLKVVRFLLLLRMIAVQFKKIIHPNAIIHVKFNQQNIAEDRMFRTLTFFMIFICSLAIGVFILITCGLNFTSAVGASIACLGNTGMGIDLVGPAGNFADLPVVGKWVCSLLMLLGRLELYAVLILFSPVFWKKP